MTLQSDPVEVRRARLSDAPRLADLSGQLGYPATVKEIRERLARVLKQREHAVFVADAGGSEVVGWLHVAVTPLLESPLRAEVNGLVVDQSQRSRGAGSQLLSAAEAWAQKKRCQHVSVRSNVIRKRAHGFYRRNGYQHIKTQKAFRKPLKPG
jgi:ribosomal protein S18 acetylase RimI-like enzyme